jgi:transcriptional/translational regulatory protein YebC/TACO1
LALEAGAEDVKQTPTGFEVISEPANFEAVKEALQKAEIEASLSELTFLAANPIQLEGKDAEQALKLMDLLEENEDVSKVHANFEISDELMEKMAAES